LAWLEIISLCNERVMGKRDTYYKEVRNKFKIWESKIDGLLEKIELIEKKSREKYSKQIFKLIAQLNAVEKDLNELKYIGQESWDDVKDCMEISINDFEDSFHKVLSMYDQQ
jgi:hypothetical protein